MNIQEQRPDRTLIQPDIQIELHQDDRSERTTADTIVGECDVTNCRFNADHQCNAGDIRIAFVQGMAHCATYDPKEGTTRFFNDQSPESV